MRVGASRGQDDVSTDAGSVRHEAIALLPDSQASDQSDADTELEKERTAAERFLTVLERNPRRGTALDKVYTFHVDRGALNSWVQKYRDRVQKEPQDGAAWMLLGLIELQRGQDAAAVQAFQNAEKNLPENALASFYLGQSLILVGQSEGAAAALERALQRKPAQIDQLEIFQALGRIYQRTQQADKALAVWQRLEKLFPNDWRIQEQIAQTLVEEGQPELALPRFEALATKASKDLYRQSQFRIQAADLKVQLSKTSEALADFEKLLGDLNPENWLYRDVRQKIEAVYLRNEDQAGLAKYYQGWLKQHPEDVDAMARLARILANQGRLAESQKWLESGLKLAPTRVELRKVIIDQLVYDRKYSAAIQQYEILNQQSPNNPDTLREWGRLILKDASKPLAQRQQAATALWKQLLIAKPKDPVVVTQVADLLRQSDLTEEAVKLYRQAIELAPEAPQYREYLGEYYHQLKRKDEALRTWRDIAQGKNRNAENLTRLGEVLGNFGYLKEGTEALQEAVKLAPQDFELRLRLSKILQRGEKFTEAVEQLAAAEKLATNPEEAESVLQQQLLAHEAARTLSTQIESLTKELVLAPAAEQVAKKPDPALAKKWYVLARYCEADGKRAAAVQAVQKALENDPRSIPILTTSARIQEQGHNLSAAADTYRLLAAIDRRSRSDYFSKVARLEGQLGRVDQALKAGREVLIAKPGNPESYDFYAQLCFQLGSQEEGLETLRRAARLNPSDAKVLILLADKLAEQFKSAEAIELYWRAFDKSPEIDGKLEIVSKLTELYLTTNHFDKLLERLERQRRADPQQSRTAALCIAQAHQTANNPAAARTELERLVTSDTRDTALLQQLAKLAASDGDYFASVTYQRQLMQIAPSKEVTEQLASYLTLGGDQAGAAELLAKSLMEEKDPEALLKAIDAMLGRGEYSQVLQVTRQVLAKEPENWEFLYREAMAQVNTHPADTEPLFSKLLSLKIPDDQQGIAAKSQQSPLSSVTGSTQSSSPSSSALRYYSRQSVVNTLLNLNGLSRQGISYTYAPQRSALPRGAMPPPQATPAAQAAQLRIMQRLMAQGRISNAMNWSPASFGEARIAAMFWLLQIKPPLAQQEFIQSVRTRWEKNKQSEEAGWDWFTLLLLPQGGANEAQRKSELLNVVRDMISHPLPSLESQIAYLNLVTQSRVATAVAANGQVVRTESSEPMSEQVIDEMLGVYQHVRENPEFRPIDASATGASLLTSIVRELRLAKRDTEAARLYRNHIDQATFTDHIVYLMKFGPVPESLEEVWQLWDRADHLATEKAAPVTAIPDIYATSLTRIMADRGAKPGPQAVSDIIAIVDRYLKAAQRQQRALAASGQAPSRSALTSIAAAHNAPTIAMVNGVRQQRSRIIYPLVIGKQGQSEPLDFPTANPHYHYESILILRNAYANCKGYGHLPTLIQHFETRSNAVELAVEDRLPWRLGLAYLHQWMGDTAAAIRVMSEICDGMPEDPDLRLQLAELHLNASNWGEVMKQVALVTHLDPDIMQKRERLALRAAIQVADTERAKIAALYLSTTKLDPASQTQLIADLQLLGLNNRAKVLTPRAVQRPSNSISSLLRQMQEHESKSHPDTAAEIALTILRRTQTLRPVANAHPSGRQIAESESKLARAAALRYLHKSKKLVELIERTEAQLESQPQSLHLNQVLLEYVSEATMNDKREAILDRLAGWDSGDANTRWDLGLQQLRVGRPAKAVPLWHAAIRLQPDQLPRRIVELELELRQQNSQTDAILVSFLNDVDLRRMGSSPYLMNIVNRLARNPATHDSGLALFKRSWNAFPAERAQMLKIQMPHLKLDATDEFYDYVREGVVPQPGQTLPDAWTGFQIDRHGANGMVSCMATRLLQSAKDHNKLGKLEQEVEQAVRAHPQWSAGPALLGIIQAQRGVISPEFKDLIKDPAWSIPAHAAWVVAQELKTTPNSEDLAIRLYERAIRSVPFGHPSRQSYEHFLFSPEQALVQLYVKQGNLEQARKVLLKCLPAKFAGGLDITHNATTETQNLCEIADQLSSLGGGMEALRIYRNLEMTTQTRPAPGAGGRSMSERVESASQAIEPAEFLADISATARAAAAKDAVDFVPAVDLLLTYVPVAGPKGDDFQTEHMKSLLADVLKKLGQDEKVYQEVKAGLQKLQVSYADDVSLHIVQCLLDLTKAQPEAAVKSLQQLETWLVAHPPEGPLASDTDHATIVKSKRLQPRIALWLIARECLEQETLRPFGERFYHRTIEVARLRKDQTFERNVCREAGLIAFYADDKARAEARWTDELEAILPRGTKPSAAPRATDQKTLIPPMTLVEFHSVCGLAHRAISKQMPNLSFKAAGIAFQAGYPIDGQRSEQGVIRFPGGTSLPKPFNTPDDAFGTWARILVRDWQDAGFPRTEIYQALTTMCLPEGNPQEVILSTQRALPRSGFATVGGTPSSLALLLVRLAIELQQVDALRERIKARLHVPECKLRAHLLAALLDVEAQDKEHGRQSLQDLCQLSEKYDSDNATDQLCHVILPALDNDELAPAAEPLMARVFHYLNKKSGGTQQKQLGDILVRMARYQFKLGHPEEGKRLLNQFQVSQEIHSASPDSSYHVYAHKRALFLTAHEFAQAGQLPDALEKLGLATDLPALEQFQDSTDSGTEVAAARRGVTVYELLTAANPEERYRLLRAWTLTGDPKTIRIMDNFGPDDKSLGALIGKFRQLAPLQFSAQTEVPKQLASLITLKQARSAKLLVQAATEANQLEALEAEVRTLAEQKVGRARELLLLIRLAHGP